MILREVADFINVGQIMPRVEAKADHLQNYLKKVEVLPPKAIFAGKTLKKELNVVKIMQPIDEKKLTRYEDIIIKLSTPYDAAIIDREFTSLVYTSFTAVIRGVHRDRLDIWFLAAYLNTDYVKEVLRQQAGATSLPVIKIRDLRELLIPDIPLERQKLLGAVYQSGAKKIELLRLMQMNEKKIINSIMVSEIKESLDGK